MVDNVKVSRFYCNDVDIEKIGALYCKTFVKKDYTVEDKEKAINNINKHADYQGFIGLKATNGNGDIVGFSYGYTSLPDQFYRRKIAAQLTEHEGQTWLGDCFEYVELAVSPSYKRLGIGSRLHDDLLRKVNHRTAILTTGVDNHPAINLYTIKGWMSIKKDVPVISEDFLQVIMGKELNEK